MTQSLCRRLDQQRFRDVQEVTRCGKAGFVHSIERARSVGSVHAIVPAARLRPYLIGAVQRGMHRTLAGRREAAGH